MNREPSLTAELLTHLPKDDVFYVLDVGASGGVEDHWLLHFGDQFFADGFDPLVREISLLNREAPSNVKYWDAFIDGGLLLRHVTSPHPEDVRLTAFDRTTASEFGRIKSQNYGQQVFNRGEALEFTSTRFSIDEFIRQHERPRPNFIKVDTDGSDLPVLLGASESLSDYACLGVQVECQFHGRPGSEGNTFANIDNLLRLKGFRIFHLDAWRYSRVDLPSEFVYSIAAQTSNGGLQWGEALYLRDPVTDGEFKQLLSESPSLLIKYLSLTIAMGQLDLTASAINEVKDGADSSLASVLSHTLNSLARCCDPSVESYDEHQEKFTQRPESFMPSDSSNDWPDEIEPEPRAPRRLWGASRSLHRFKGNTL